MAQVASARPMALPTARLKALWCEGLLPIAAVLCLSLLQVARRRLRLSAVPKRPGAAATVDA